MGFLFFITLPAIQSMTKDGSMSPYSLAPEDAHSFHSFFDCYTFTVALLERRVLSLAGEKTSSLLDAVARFQSTSAANASSDPVLAA